MRRKCAALLCAVLLLGACGGGDRSDQRSDAPERESAPVAAEARSAGGHAASGDGASPPARPVRIEERWLTARNERDNVDSVAVWADGAGRHWLLATAKESDVLIVYDAATGERLRAFGGRGEAPGEFRRPNGIFVADDRVWVVERDNRRVQVLSLPDFEPLVRFGDDVLTRPYGLWLDRVDDGYRLFVTDAYETPDERVPPDAQLDRRLHRFDLALENGTLELTGHRVLGPTEGEGRLLKVESLWGDAASGRLLVADEHASRLNLKLFDLEGAYTGRTVADGILQYEPEGIALQRCGEGEGYWIVTDQDERDNRFLVLERRSLALAGAFTGVKTRNTDGVWLHPEPLGEFSDGVFYAVHDDGNVAAFDWGEVLERLSLDPSCSADRGA